jgi:hypothetical protein
MRDWDLGDFIKGAESADDSRLDVRGKSSIRAEEKHGSHCGDDNKDPRTPLDISWELLSNLKYSRRRRGLLILFLHSLFSDD